MASLGSSSLPLSLRPWPGQKAEHDQLQFTIGRMQLEHGGFRQITEDALIQEIADAKNGDKPADEQSAEAHAPQVGDVKGEKGTKEYIIAMKAKMMQNLGTALNDTLMAIDFTSLLESKYLPKQGEQSISAYLKQKLPIGSLAYDKWEMPPRSKQKDEDEELIAKGWRMEGLTSAADVLLSAATRLEQDVKRETSYWAQVLSVKQKGWTVFRHPLNPQSLSVQVGSRESGALFAERGVVTFKADEEGTISLGQSMMTEPKMIRVRVSRNGKIVGVSRTLVTRSDSESQSPLESLVHEARDSLFEEELFHEITVETRALLYLGVKLRGSTIHIPSAPQAEIAGASDEVLIDLAPLDEFPEAGQDASSDELAQSLALALRLLLSHLHRTRLRRRTTIPAPIAESRRPDPPSTILRPLMMALQHQYATWRLKTSFEDVVSVLQKAGFTVELNQQQIPNSRNTPPLKDNAVPDRLANPIISSLSFPLPSSSSKELSQKEHHLPPHSLVVEILTQFSQAPFSTEYSLTIPPPLTRILYPRSLPRPRSLAFPTVDALMIQIYSLIAFDITTNVLAALHPSWKASLATPLLGAVVQVNGKEKRVDIGVSAGLRMDTVGAEERSIFIIGTFCKVTNETRVLNRLRWGMEDDDEGKGGLVDVVDGWIKEWGSVGKTEDEA